MRRLIVVAMVNACLLSAAVTVAAPINLDFVRGTGSDFRSVLVDQATGEILERNGFNGQNFFNRYSNYAAFEAGTVGSTLSTSQSYFGTYAGFTGGEIYGRSTQTTTVYQKWDTSSGAVTQSTSLPDFNPINFSGGFNWGGFSSLNTLSNQDGLYVLGKSSVTPNSWRLESIDSNLNSSFIGDISLSSAGFAFLIGDFLFFGDSFSSPQISTRYDIVNNVQTTVNFTLTGHGSFNYWSNFVYDSTTDTLIGNNRDNRVGTGGYYAVRNASGAFGVPSDSVSIPEPSSLALLGIGLLGMGLARRRKKA